MTGRKIRMTLASVGGALVLVSACEGERFTSDQPGGGAGGADKGGAGGSTVSGGTRAFGGANNGGGEAGGDAGEFGNGGSLAAGRDSGGRPGSVGGESAGGMEGGAGAAGAGDGGRAGAGAGAAGKNSGGKSGGTGGTVSSGGTVASGGKSGGTGGTNSGGKSGGTGGTNSGGKSGGTGGTTGGTLNNSGGKGGTGGTTGGTLNGTGGSIIVAGASAGGASSGCELPAGTVVLLDEPFNTDVFTSGGWVRTDTSVTVSGGLFKIAGDNQYDDYGDISLTAMAPLVVEVRMRNVSGGTEELTPVVEVHFGTDTSGVVSISYNAHAGYGWIFGPPGAYTNSTIEAPESEGVWTTIRAFLRVDGGTLCAKRDDEMSFTLAGASIWQLPKSITRLRLRQNYDDVSEIDRVIIRQPP